jgi:uncharacterized protein YbjT (DUF2867 family)
LLGTHKGVEELLGAEKRTMPELAKLLGDAVGRPISFVSVPDAAAAGAMEAAGMSAEAARRMTELYAAMNEGRVGAVARSVSNTTATTVEAFLRDVAPAFRR